MSTKTLTGDDIALASFACAHAINWVKARGHSKYWRNERAKYEALSQALQELLDEAYPGLGDVELSFDFGTEPIMRTDARVVRSTQARMRKAATS